MNIECIWGTVHNPRMVTLPAADIFEYGVPIDDDGDDMTLTGALADGENVDPWSVIVAYENCTEQYLPSLVTDGVLINDLGDDMKFKEFYIKQ